MPKIPKESLYCTLATLLDGVLPAGAIYKAHLPNSSNRIKICAKPDVITKISERLLQLGYVVETNQYYLWIL